MWKFDHQNSQNKEYIFVIRLLIVSLKSFLKKIFLKSFLKKKIPGFCAISNLSLWAYYRRFALAVILPWDQLIVPWYFITTKARIFTPANFIKFSSFIECLYFFRVTAILFLFSCTITYIHLKQVKNCNLIGLQLLSWLTMTILHPFDKFYGFQHMLRVHNCKMILVLKNNIYI